MGSNYVRRIVLLMALLAPQIAVAKTIYFGSAPETVPVVVGSVTVVRFEDPVKTISNAAGFVIKPVNEETPDYALLSIEPRMSSGKTDVSFILANGDVARLRLAIVPRDIRIKTDGIFDIKSQKSLVQSREASMPYIGRIELITAMIRGDQVTGYETSKSDREITNPGKGTRVVLQRVYSGDEFRGYVYLIQNLSSFSTVSLDVRKVQLGNPNQAVLAFSDLDTLDKAGSGNDRTRLIIVAKPGSSSQDAILPIRRVKVDGGDKGEKHD